MSLFCNYIWPCSWQISQNYPVRISVENLPIWLVRILEKLSLYIELTIRGLVTRWRVSERNWKLSSLKQLVVSENTHLLHKGKCHCMADLLFDWFGFDQTCKSLSNSTQAKQLNLNWSNRSSAIQWDFPLQSKWVFSGCIFVFLNMIPIHDMPQYVIFIIS